MSPPRTTSPWCIAPHAPSSRPGPSRASRPISPWHWTTPIIACLSASAHRPCSWCWIPSPARRWLGCRAWAMPMICSTMRRTGASTSLAAPGRSALWRRRMRIITRRWQRSPRPRGRARRCGSLSSVGWCWRCPIGARKARRSGCMRSHSTPHCAACAGTLVLVLLGLLASSAWGYRPFVSTDAAVVERARMEIELGYLTLVRTQGENTFMIPQVVLNYGLTPTLELVGEFKGEESPESGLQLVDPALSLKAVLREGILQEKAGVSVAVEMGLLLPSTVPSERRFGFEGVGIVSLRMSPFTFHLNLGGGVDREATRPFGVWGVITELPIGATVRLAGEIDGESVQGQAANNSGLLGVLWQPPWLNAVVDAGIRRGFSRGAPDWLFTTGLTFSFPLLGSGRQ